MNEPEVRFEDFQRYFPYTPTALNIKECVRLSALRHYRCAGPILDVGCGDGLFAKLAFDGMDVWGIDINAEEGRHAQASRAYSQIILADITRAHVPEALFATCVANCSIEHVPDIDAGLRVILRSLCADGNAYFFVPNRDWTRHFLSVRKLQAVGAVAVADRIECAINSVFKHHHLYDEQGWREVVTRAGFEVVKVDPVGSTATTVAFEMFLLPSLAGWINKRLTTRWTNFPKFRTLAARPVYELVKAALAIVDDPSPTAELLLICRKPRQQP